MRFPVLDQIRKAITELGISAEEWEHTVLLTTSDAIKEADRPGAIHTKTIALKDKSGVICVVTTSAHRRIDFKRAQSAAEVGRTSMADEEVVAERLGVDRGALAPFGYLPEIRCVIDSDITSTGKEVLISPGRNTTTIALRSEDFEQLARYFTCILAPVGVGPN
jgi:prolyl-tRNA editing enzyme YbaK/EbsC (Cys-tRNA(Pro) deacylase)